MKKTYLIIPVMTALLFGLLPAIRATRRDVNATLRQVLTQDDAPTITLPQ